MASSLLLRSASILHSPSLFSSKSPPFPSPCFKSILIVSKSQDIGVAGKAAIAAGLVSNPAVAWSLYTLKTTGCGLPPGPGGSLGALEGVSFLVIAGLVSWSLFTRVKTGSGLPSGPFGLLGAVEGLSYLTVVAIAVVFGLQYLEYGYIPGPVPAEKCFG